MAPGIEILTKVSEALTPGIEILTKLDERFIYSQAIKIIIPSNASLSSDSFFREC